MMHEKSQRKNTEQQTKRSATKRTERIFKLAALPCVAILMFQLFPTSEERTDSSMASTPQRRGVLHRSSRDSYRRDGAWNSVSGKYSVSEEFMNQPELLQHTLGGFSSRVKANTLDGVVEGDDESIENLERTVSIAPKSGERLDAVEALTQTNDVERARHVLSRVVETDQNAEVRLAALDALDEIDEVPFEALAQAASKDFDSEIRLRALELIGERKEKDESIFQLLNRVARTDSNKDVRRLARGLLEAMIRGN